MFQDNEMIEGKIKAGDWFVYENDHIYIIVAGIDSMASLNNLMDGGRYYFSHKIADRHNITPSEFKKMSDGDNFRRYRPSDRHLLEDKLNSGAKMNWLTPKYIKEQSQISDEAALECSIEHWQQIYDAPVEEIKNHDFKWDRECSLCVRSRCCGDCLLGEHGGCSTNSTYQPAATQVISIQRGKTTKKDKIKAMLDLLISLREENIMFKVGDKVRTTDLEAAFGFENGVYIWGSVGMEGVVTGTGYEFLHLKKQLCSVVIHNKANGASYFAVPSKLVKIEPEKTITVKGKDYSEDTLVKMIKAYTE
jgi:hypothetical protein